MNEIRLEWKKTALPAANTTFGQLPSGSTTNPESYILLPAVAGANHFRGNTSLLNSNHMAVTIEYLRFSRLYQKYGFLLNDVK